ncbi:aspartate aminotransferase family protein [Halobacteriales archaeon QS_1_68_20]|nr:MAG: aspartate aminotransferase family protein [Halobacteriales archaeon QS_1_68_20]
MYDQSRELYDRALSVTPGGVNSPVRAAYPYPNFVGRGEGAHLIDVDGNRYVDYVMAYGPLLLGHTLPEEVEGAIQSQLSDGPMYGVPTEVEVELAEFIARHVPSVEQVRFVNSGTEATTSAVRLARGYTGRDDIVVMQGNYHGAQESTLVEGDDEERGPSSEGIPSAFAEHTIPVPFNDVEAVERVFEERGEDIAAVMLEPMLGNRGIVHPVDGYLERLRELTEEHGALLVFDEVMTGFRIGGLSCAQGAFGVEPDLTTFGKVIGGGFPVGAIGGSAAVMESFTPVGDVFQAGTFSGHPVTMTAGLETLRYAAENDVYDYLQGLGDELRSGLQDIVEDQAPEYTVVGRDSMFKVIFTREAPDTFEGHCEAGCRQQEACPRFDRCPKNGADVAAANTERWERIFYHEMRDRGIMLTTNQFEPQFLSYAHTEEDVENTLEAYKEAL